MPSTSTRRAFLAGTGVALSASLAGCSSAGNSRAAGELVVYNGDSEPHTVTIIATRSFLVFHTTETRTVSLAGDGGKEDLSDLLSLGTTHLHVRTDTGATADQTIHGPVQSYAGWVITVSNDRVDVAYHEN